MSRDVASSVIFKKVSTHPRVKPMKEQSVRDAISNIHKNNPGVTMNGAAQVFAKRKKFSVFRYLSHADPGGSSKSGEQVDTVAEP